MDELKKALALYPKKTIDFNALQQISRAYVDSYEVFAREVLQLEEEGVLTMVKSKGRAMRKPSIALQYRVNHAKLKQAHHHIVQQFRMQFHPAINLDYYYNNDPKIWETDLPFLKKIDAYLRINGFPEDMIPAPERSFALVGDEKWLTEKKGKELLERVHLLEKMGIVPVSDPLQFAINPGQIKEQVQFHLIVENKTTYQGLLQKIEETTFATLIYGSGKAIIHRMEQFEQQYPVKAQHYFFYFGDIDREGMNIWYSLTKKRHVALALPFYRACLKKVAAKGKEYQRKQLEAEQAFLEKFSDKEKVQMEEKLREGYYYPQEILQTKELQEIWEESNWTELI